MGNFIVGGVLIVVSQKLEYVYIIIMYYNYLRLLLELQLLQLCITIIYNYCQYLCLNVFVFVLYLKIVASRRNVFSSLCLCKNITTKFKS